MIENKWLEIALYPGCIQGFFLTYLLWQKKDTNREAIRYFSALLLTISILMLLRVTYQPAFFKQFAEIILLPDVILFLTGPFIYLFTRALLRLAPMPPSLLYPHFIPAAVHVLVVNSFLGLHLKGVLHYLNIRQIIWGFNLIELAAMLSFGMYTAWSLRTYQKYRTAFYEKYATPLVGHFLRSFFVLCFVLLVFWFVGFVVKVVQSKPDYSIYTLFWVLVVAAIYFLAYKIWATPTILHLPKVLETENDDREEAPVSESDIAALQHFMETQKPYLNAEIKIGDLADAMSLPKHQLSKIINQGFQKNFFDFINSYRVRAFMHARTDARQQHLNTLELAYQSGFNSKSAFNRAFLKETGRSPRDFFAGSGQSNGLD
ncbi:MAG: helix-turn-helix transcriptional regulator [Saprospiraceae bacterium]|nr:helix-turn-helix transcriptional regulator [Saprospiraceae bacterium]